MFFSALSYEPLHLLCNIAAADAATLTEVLGLASLHHERASGFFLKKKLKQENTDGHVVRPELFFLLSFTAETLPASPACLPAFLADPAKKGARGRRAITLNVFPKGADNGSKPFSIW